MPLLDVVNLTVMESRRNGWGKYAVDAARLVDGVSLSVGHGQTVAVVGENTSGTLPLALALIGLLPIAAGEARYDGQSLSGLSERKLRPFRQLMRVLFSDDFGALPPHQTIGRMLLSAQRLAGQSRKRSDRIREVETAMERARLPMATRSELPGAIDPSDRQRAQLARALLSQPRLLICHDFTRGLDASVQASLLNRLCDLRDEFGLTLLVMTHDLAVADHLASQIHIMSRGRIVESGTPSEILAAPTHEYTRRLIAAAVSPH